MFNHFSCLPHFLSPRRKFGSPWINGPSRTSRTVGWFLHLFLFPIHSNFLIDHPLTSQRTDLKPIDSFNHHTPLAAQSKVWLENNQFNWLTQGGEKHVRSFFTLSLSFCFWAQPHLPSQPLPLLFSVFISPDLHLIPNSISLDHPSLMMANQSIDLELINRLQEEWKWWGYHSLPFFLSIALYPFSTNHILLHHPFS